MDHCLRQHLPAAERTLSFLCLQSFRNPAAQKNAASLDGLEGVDASQKRALPAAAGADDDRDLAL